MKYEIISTGSKGNAVIFNDIVMIDCGVSFKALREVYTRIGIVLLTHIHGDHFKKTTIRRLSEERPTLRFGCCEWLVKPLLQLGVDKKNIDVLETGVIYDYRTFRISPVMLYHDVQNCGYRLYFGKEKAIYITDTSTVEGIKAENYDLYLIEANYTDEDIQERIAKKEKTGEYIYERNVPDRHLSKAQADDFIYSNIGSNGMYVYLHQHEERKVKNEI